MTVPTYIFLSGATLSYSMYAVTSGPFCLGLLFLVRISLCLKKKKKLTFYTILSRIHKHFLIHHVMTDIILWQRERERERGNRETETERDYAIAQSHIDIFGLRYLPVDILIWMICVAIWSHGDVSVCAPIKGHFWVHGPTVAAGCVDVRDPGYHQRPWDICDMCCSMKPCCYPWATLFPRAILMWMTCAATWGHTRVLDL